METGCKSALSFRSLLFGVRFEEENCMRRKSLLLVVSALLLFGGATDAMSQQFTGTMRGVVSDAQGIIPGVTVTLTNEGTTVARETTTNAVGEYTFPAVTPGTYSVRTSLPGYKTYEQRGISVGTATALTIDLLLEVGTVEEEITVTADAPLIETSTASVGDTLDREILETLPAPGRNAFLVAVTIPTVTPIGDPQFNRQQDQSNASRISLGGGAIRNNNYLLDGVPITELNNRAVLNPTIESLSDVKVQVHTYDAEMGRTGGGVFNTTGRVGTNEFHGSGFYQTRPVWGQSMNYFSGLSGETKESSGIAASYYRLYGGGMGGPILQNRTFWWYAMEGYRSFTTRNQTQTWPGTKQRVGDFSNSSINGVSTRIWNPWCRGITTATARCPATGSGSIATPEFTGAIIPTSHGALSPAAKAITALWPTTTVSGKSYDGTIENGDNNVGDTSRTIDLADMYTFKVEHKFTDNWSLSGMYIYNKTDEPSYSYILPGTAKDDYFSSSGAWYLERRPHVLVFNNTNILNDSTVLTMRYGWTRWLDATTPGLYEPGAAGLGFDSSYTSALEATLGQKMIPQINFAGDVGYFDVGKSAGSTGRVWKSPFALNAAVSKLAGSHSFKIGGDFREMGIATPTRYRQAGSFSFDERFTSDGSGTGGHEFASFLLGAPHSGYVDANRGLMDLYVRYWAAYIQDDWRVNSRFTLNFGVRVDHEDGMREKQNRFTYRLNKTVDSPLNDVLNSNGVTVETALGRTIKGGLEFAGVNGAPEQHSNMEALRVSPRLGMTYSLDDRTVLRGGYGMFYAPWNFSNSNQGQVGFTRATDLTQSSPGAELPLTALDNPYPNGLQSPVGSALGLLTGVGGGIAYVDDTQTSGQVHQYSIDVQREIGSDMALTVGYTGATGRAIGYCGSNSSCRPNINQIRPAAARAAYPGSNGWDPDALQASVANPFYGAAGAGEFKDRATISAGQLIKDFPQYTNVEVLQMNSGGKRQYNALVFKLDKRTGSSAWGGRLSYTMSSTKDNQWGQSSGYASRTATPQDAFNMNVGEYATSIFDSPHRVILAPIIRIPGPGEDMGFANILFGGWTMSAVVELVSGAPLNAVASSGQSSTNCGGACGRQRPNVSGSASSSGSDSARVASKGQESARWFNASAFTNAGKGVLGSAPRTITEDRYQFRKNIDMVIAKDTEIGAGAVAQVRFELLNVTNTPKFGGISSNAYNSSSFGRVTQQVGFMRIWQLSFRLTY
tara:strand:+ start:6137 stop:9850 length:3714 start_codon:yes stop_codon:yes gene_type:complete